MKNEFEVAFNEIAELRSLDPNVVLEALQTALVSAYRRDVGASAAQRVEATIDPLTGRARIYVEKEVVKDKEEVSNPNTEVELEKARFYDPSVNVGDVVMAQVEGTTKKFGRIAAQTAKQVILQRIREAERTALYDEFIEREGDLITGTVQSVNSAVVTLSLGRAEAIMPRAQQIPGERYKPHEKLRTYVMEVKRSNRGPQIVVSRAHRNMLRRLLEYEVPEIFNGQVEIKNIAREAGYRSKVAVSALQEGIDPVGACVGMRGVRIQNIVKELHDEKIDVIEWNPNQEIFIAKALSPARVAGVYLEDDPDTGRTAVVIVPDDQLSLAIGREGQNARLAAKLTGWRIDIKNVSEAVQYTLDNLDRAPLSDLQTQYASMIEDVKVIVQKKAGNRAIMPEEFQVLSKFADLAERQLLTTREQTRQVRIAEFNAVRSTLPKAAFDLPVTTLDLPDEIIEALQPLENVGEIMLRFLIDEKRIHSLLSHQPKDAFARLQDALDKLVIPEDNALEIAAAEAIGTAEPAAAPVVGDESQAAITEEGDKGEKVAGVVSTDELDVEEFYDEDDEDIQSGKGGKKKKKERQQRRQLVYDEELGTMVVKRRRKGSRSRSGWEEEG